MTTKRDEQMADEYADGNWEKLDNPRQWRSCVRAFLAGRESLRSELKLTDEEKHMVDHLRVDPETNLTIRIELIKIIDRLTAQESE